MLEELGRYQCAIRTLQEQAHEWLFVAERFGSTGFRWKDYATDWETDPGFHKERAFKQAMEIAIDSPGTDRDALLDQYPDLVLAAGRSARWKRVTIPVDGQPFEARVLWLPYDTVICLLDLPAAYVVLYGRPLITTAPALENMPDSL
jgi:hypothetical protein